MKLPAVFVSSIFLTSTTTITAAAAPPPRLPNVQAPLQPLPPYLIMPPPSSTDDKNAPKIQVQRGVPLADILGTQRSITTFSAFSRQFEAVSAIFEDESVNSTVLAPLNSAIEKLDRKPWEDPREYASLGEQAYDGSGGKSRADDNMRRFVEAHILVGTSPWDEGVKAKTAGGRTLWWETKEDGEGREKRVILPDNVEVERVASQVANGELWLLKGVLSDV